MSYLIFKLIFRRRLKLNILWSSKWDVLRTDQGKSTSRAQYNLWRPIKMEAPLFHSNTFITFNFIKNSKALKAFQCENYVGRNTWSLKFHKHENLSFCQDWNLIIYENFWIFNEAKLQIEFHKFAVEAWSMSESKHFFRLLILWEAKNK